MKNFLTSVIAVVLLAMAISFVIVGIYEAYINLIK